MLLVGPRHINLLQFVNRLIALLICDRSSSPCGVCRACHLLLEGLHPDIRYIGPEDPSRVIKIEQVRELQQGIYQTPQRGSRRFIVIESTDKMNNAAANALLKILEEPPLHTMFILMSEQVSSIPATLLSRCQIYTFSSLAHEPAGYLAIGTAYPEGTRRAELMAESTAMIMALSALIEEKVSPCTIALEWSKYAIDDILWLLYLITAEAIQYQLIKINRISPQSEALIYFSQLTNPLNLLKQLDKIIAILSNVNQHINMNQTLMLETLLLSYRGE